MVPVTWSQSFLDVDSYPLSISIVPVLGLDISFSSGDFKHVLFVEMLGRGRGLTNTVKNEPQQRPGVRFERSRCVILMVLKTYRKRQQSVMPYYFVVVRNRNNVLALNTYFRPPDISGQHIMYKVDVNVDDNKSSSLWDLMERISLRFVVKPKRMAIPDFRLVDECSWTQTVD